jgi:hypothetical protein
MEASPNISQNIHHRILARGSRGHVCGLSMAACRNGGLTRAASIPAPSCVARTSLPYHASYMVSFGHHTVMTGRHRPRPASQGRPSRSLLPADLPRPLSHELFFSSLFISPTARRGRCRLSSRLYGSLSPALGELSHYRISRPSSHLVKGARTA